MHKGQKVKIAKLDFNDHQERYPCLAVGSRGKIVDEWMHPWRHEKVYWVVMEDGEKYPFYFEEIVRC